MKRKAKQQEKKQARCCLAENVIYSLFFSSSLFFSLLISLNVIKFGVLGQAAGVVLCIATLLALAVISVKASKPVSLTAAALFVLFMYSVLFSKHFSSVALSFFMFTFPFAWLKFVKKKEFSEMLSELKITREGLLRNIVLGVALTLFLLLPLMFAEVLVLRWVGINDVENVGNLLLAAPWWLPVFAVVFAPIAEELFFRAFLISRLGLLASTLVFTVAHYSYGSIAEFVGAFTIGLLFGVLFLRTRNVASVIAAHFVFNLVSIAVIFLGSYL